MFDKETHDYARERIKSSLTMEDILDAYYYTSPRKKVCCPFHEEKTPSFSYKDDYYSCFGCGEKGDTITFVQKYFNLLYTEALQKIDADFHLNVYKDESWRTPEAVSEVQAAIEQRRKEQQQQLAEQNQINTLYDEIAALEKEVSKLRPSTGIRPEEKDVIAFIDVQIKLRDKEVFLEELLTEQYAKRYQERIEKESRKPEQSEVSKKVEERKQSKVAKENHIKEEFEVPPIMGENGLPITLEKYERPPVIEEDDMKPRYLSPPELPGWKVELYDDGSGCFISPEGKEMYSFDKSTGEYMAEDGHYTSFYDDPGVPVSGDKDLVNKIIRHIAEKQMRIEQNPTAEVPQAVSKNTVVVNLLAGPGAGKTTCAWEIAEKLKKNGYAVEYVSEVAKDYVWDENFEMLDGSKKNQISLLKEQKHRVDRLIGKVDFVVTDAPMLLNAVYLTEGTEQDKKEYSGQVKATFDEYNNFVIFIERGKSFEKIGRIHDEAQSRELDNQVRKLLADNDVYYGTYRHDTIDVSIANMIKTLKRVQNPQLQDKKMLKIDNVDEAIKHAMDNGSEIPKSVVGESEKKQDTSPMLFTAHIYPLRHISKSAEEALLANVKVQLNNQLEFSAEIIEKKNGDRLMSVPQYCTSDGNFRPIVYLEKKMYQRLQGEVLKGYSKNENTYVESGKLQPVEPQLKKVFLTDYEKIKGYAEVSIGNTATVSRIKVVDGEYGEFVAMPTMAAYMDKDGKTIYPEAVTVLDKEFKKELNTRVIAAYKAATEKQGRDKAPEWNADESSIEKYINYTNYRAAEEISVKQVGVMSQQANNGRDLE